MAPVTGAAPAGRWLFVAALALAWAGTLVSAGAIPGGVAAVIGLSIAFAGSAIAFAARVAPALGGAGMLALLWLAASWDSGNAPVSGGNQHHGALMPAAALAAYLAGQAAVRRGSPAAREHAGVEAACGTIGAVYGLSAISKLAGAGLGWLEGGNLALLIAERSFVPGWLGAVRRSVAEHSAWCGALAVATFAIEAAGILWLWPRTRRIAAVLAIALHAGIALLLGYVYASWVLVVVSAAWFGFGAEASQAGLNIRRPAGSRW